MKISIIIPTHNRKNYLKVLLQQIGKQLLLSNICLDVIVVVDGSTDGTFKMLTKDFPDAHVVSGPGNWWYTKSMNEGFKYAAENIDPDYVLTFNDDIEIRDDYIDVMLRDINKISEPCILGSLSLTHSEPKRITGAGVKKLIRWRFKLVTYYDFLDPINNHNLEGVHPSVVLPGRGMLIPFGILRELNYFDETFKQYSSDFDFCLRAGYSGYKSFVSWNARTFSHVKLSSSSSSFIKKPIGKFIINYFNPYSRTHLVSKAIYIWRHGIKTLWPITFLIFVLATIKANLINKKI